MVRTEDYAVASWAAAPVSAAPADANRINNQTVRNVIHLSVGGDKVRVKFSNRYGTQRWCWPGHPSRSARAANPIVPGTSRTLTFAVSLRRCSPFPSARNSPSDWADLRSLMIKADLAVDIYLASDTSASTSPVTLHNARPAGQILSYLATGVSSAPAHAAHRRQLGRSGTSSSGLDVAGAAQSGAIVARSGDSITDGSGVDAERQRALARFLARRTIAGQSGIRPMGVPNLGIGGNRVLKRRHREPAIDALRSRCARCRRARQYIIVLEGINDISGGPTSLRAIIQGHQQLIKRAHARGLKIYGAHGHPILQRHRH